MLAIVLLLVLVVGYFGGGITGFVAFEGFQLQDDLILGNFERIKYEHSALVLEDDVLEGKFESQIFDFGEEVLVNGFNWEGEVLTSEVIYLVDKDARVWSSFDNGVSWNVVKEDFNGAKNNNADWMISKDGELFVLHREDLWKSPNAMDWELINDDFNGIESGTGVVLIDGFEKGLFVIDSNEDVWNSLDFGLTWDKVFENFNENKGDVRSGIYIEELGFFVVDKSASVWKSNDGLDWELLNDDYNLQKGNDADDLIYFNGEFFILHNQDVWKSSNALEWALVSDDFNPKFGTQGELIFNFKSELFIVDRSGGIWKSSSGDLWELVNENFNSDKSRIKGSALMDRKSSIGFEFRVCNVKDCSDSEFFESDEFIGLQGRYLQYNILMSRESLDVEPYVSDVNFDYGFVLVDEIEEEVIEEDNEEVLDDEVQDEVEQEGDEEVLDDEVQNEIGQESDEVVEEVNQGIEQTSSSGGSGGGSSKKVVEEIFELNVGKLDPISLEVGDKADLFLKIENIGTGDLTNCKLSNVGLVGNWLNSKQVVDLPVGKSVDFIVGLEIPEGFRAGRYLGSVGVLCDEVRGATDLKIEVIASENLEGEVIEIQEEVVEESRRGLTGLAVFEQGDGNIYGVIVLIGVLGAYGVFVFLRKHHKRTNHKKRHTREFIRLDLGI